MRTFDVLAWPEAGGYVVYVPEVEALARAGGIAEVDGAARDLIAELLGLAAESIEVRTRLERRRPWNGGR